ncbi:hypothetical protein PHISP_01165 [Aspergillus sp. HF37]|nr:hypothetical protein PHISP_01165 [Aspergillus sp. HF37]
MSNSEDSNASLSRSRSLDEEDWTSEDESTSPTAQTESDSLQHSLDEKNEALYKIEHEAHDLDRENAGLRVVLDDVNDFNARQREEFESQEEELQTIKARLHEEYERNDVNESYIEAAEETNQHLREENSTQADLLKSCINERKQLVHELGGCEEAINNLHTSLERTDQLTSHYDEVIAGYRHEREGWMNEPKANAVSEQNQVLQRRLTRAIEMGETSEDMCLTARAHSFLDWVDFDNARKRTTCKEITNGPSVTPKLNKKRTKKGTRAIRSPSDETMEDAPEIPLEMPIQSTKPSDVVMEDAPNNPLGKRIRSANPSDTAMEDAPGNPPGMHIPTAKPPGNLMASDTSISSKFGRMSIDADTEYVSATESEYHSVTESEYYTGTESEYISGTGSESESTQESEKEASEEASEDEQMAARYDNRPSWSQRNEHHQNQLNEQIQNLSRPAQPKPVYSREMDWEKTERYSSILLSGASDMGASTNDGNRRGILARKRPRCQISTDEQGTAEAEANTDWPAKQVKVCPFCGVANQDATRRISLTEEGNVANPRARHPASECLEHQRQSRSVGVQAEEESDRALEQVLVATQVEELPTASTSVQTSEVRVSSVGTQVEKSAAETVSAGVQATRVSESSKGIQTKGTSMLSTTAQTDPVHIWKPARGSRPHSQGTRKEKSKRNRESPKGMKNIPNSSPACSQQPKGEREKQPTVALQPKPPSVLQEWWVPAFLVLGLLMYIWYSTKEEQLWMKANRVPRSMLRELRDGQSHHAGWMKSLNYKLVQWLGVDRVTRG